MARAFPTFTMAGHEPAIQIIVAARLDGRLLAAHGEGMREMNCAPKARDTTSLPLL